MDDIVSSPPETNIRKRCAPEEEHQDGDKPLNLKGNQFIMPTPPDTEESSNASPDASNNNDDMGRAASPASSSILSSAAEVTISNNGADSNPMAGPANTAAPQSTSGPPPTKRRKLTPSEKVEAARLKDTKARETAEKKALKEAEKARKEEEKAKQQIIRDENKRLNDEKKRQKAEEAEAKKREKELAKQREAHEKLEKERKQMRLGNFFQTPATPARQDGDGNESQPGTARRKSLSLEPYDAVAERIKISASPARGTPPPEKKPVVSKRAGLSDYQRTFLPFMLPTNSTLAPLPQQSSATSDLFDHELDDPSLREKFDLGIADSYAELAHYFAVEPGTTRGEPVRSIKEIVGLIDGTVKQPIDLTGMHAGDNALDHLRKASIRHIEFQQDVRPAYFGTYTKISSPRKLHRVRRNPFIRARPDTDYDNDSEAEWEEPEEGDEEIMSEAEDEADSQGDANEIDDFLDDEEDNAKSKRRVATGELVPETTGLCWENEAHHLYVVESIETNKQPPVMHGMRIGMMLPGLTEMTIDPFSDAYWQSTAMQPPGGSMPPPRAPLQPRLNVPETGLVGATEGHRGPITTVAASQNQGAKRGPKPAPRTLSKEDLAEFKEAVIDSPLGKLELQKGLKARFPKLTHDAIKETLGTQFAQTGLTKADKKWVYVGES
ncbi:uncharacterized protein RCC_07440 [Ramularia collo-cygni]|uniref:Chromatin assembly complex, subunit p90 n=1 Tax=Ramularia collo-cygni TaxID=112498 RepID=A0A2D3VCU4_9PEZI|nr:uncharacterized protein RCC_07440 [Ramularia collo-cygni]CZT21576.1 uncharacterized protein RCC_07440 [Ramularia collo-cygni]